MIQDVEEIEGRCYVRDDIWEEVCGSDVCIYIFLMVFIWGYFKEEL